MWSLLCFWLIYDRRMCEIDVCVCACVWVQRTYLPTHLCLLCHNPVLATSIHTEYSSDSTYRHIHTTIVTMRCSIWRVDWAVKASPAKAFMWTTNRHLKVGRTLFLCKIQSTMPSGHLLLSYETVEPCESAIVVQQRRKALNAGVPGMILR